VPGVTVTLSGDDSQADITAADGLYSFNVNAGGNYTVTPSKNNDITTSNGITTLDNVLMQRQILAVLPLSTPYRIIAADVNGSSSVTTLDIVLSRAVILGNSPTYPNGKLWTFVNSDFSIAAPLNPFPFEKTRTYNNLNSNQTNQNFIGIKLGDVNGSWDSTIP